MRAFPNAKDDKTKPNPNAADYFWLGSDSYEEYSGTHFMNYKASSIYPSRSTDSPYRNLFALFKNMAEKADDYPSDDVKGENDGIVSIERMNKKYFG